jgi:hypothetical protein
VSKSQEISSLSINAHSSSKKNYKKQAAPFEVDLVSIKSSVEFRGFFWQTFREQQRDRASLFMLFTFEGH